MILQVPCSLIDSDILISLNISEKHCKFLLKNSLPIKGVVSNCDKSVNCIHYNKPKCLISKYYDGSDFISLCCGICDNSYFIKSNTLVFCKKFDMEIDMIKQYTCFISKVYNV